MPWLNSRFSSISTAVLANMEPAQLIKLAYENPHDANLEEFPISDGTDGWIPLSRMERKIFLLIKELERRSSDIQSGYEGAASTKGSSKQDTLEDLFMALEARIEFATNYLLDNVTLRIQHNSDATHPILVLEYGYVYMCLGDCPDCLAGRQALFSDHWVAASKFNKPH
jgi:hypothetical protein